MIKEFIDLYFERKYLLLEKYSKSHPENYDEIVKSVIELLSTDKDGKPYHCPDPKEIQELCFSSYQGALVYVIPEISDYPCRFWYVRMYYGTCGGCDTLYDIKGYCWDGTPSKKQTEQYMQLCLHIVQSIKEMDEDSVV